MIPCSHLQNYFQVLADGQKPRVCQEAYNLYGIQKLINIKYQYMKNDIQEYPTSETSEISQMPRMPTSLPSPFLAATSLLPGKVKALKEMIAGYGLKRNGLLGVFDQDTWLLKTAQCSLFEDYTSYLDRLPVSGIMQNGHVYKAHSLVSSNTVKGYILLPTPIKNDSRGSGRQYFGASTNKWKKGAYQLNAYIRDGEQDGIYPNPELTEALMTFPVGYTDLQVQEMPSYL